MTEVKTLEKTLFQDNAVGDIKFFRGSNRNVVVGHFEIFNLAAKGKKAPPKRGLQGL